MKLSNNSMNTEQAKDFLKTLCGNSNFGKQVYENCVGTLFNVGYFVSSGVIGGRSGKYVNDYTKKSLTNHYNKILRSYN